MNKDIQFIVNYLEGKDELASFTASLLRDQQIEKALAQERIRQVKILKISSAHDSMPAFISSSGEEGEDNGTGQGKGKGGADWREIDDNEFLYDYCVDTNLGYCLTAWTKETAVPKHFFRRHDKSEGRFPLNYKTTKTLAEEFLASRPDLETGGSTCSYGCRLPKHLMQNAHSE